MKVLTLSLVTALSTMLASCSIFKAKEPKKTNTVRAQNTQVQSEDSNKVAHDRAEALTSNWPQSSVIAAKEMVTKHGEPSEVTQDSLIWKNVQPFKRIIVHKEVYSSRFPLLHQNAVEHVVDYKAPMKKIDEVWNYNGSVVLDRVRGEMAAGGENESMNILSLNLANEVLQGKRTPDGARIQHGKEALNYLNGNKTAYTSTLAFGSQINTSDTGETITNKIRWVGDKTPAKTRKMNDRQAEEEAPR